MQEHTHTSPLSSTHLNTTLLALHTNTHSHPPLYSTHPLTGREQKRWDSSYKERDLTNGASGFVPPHTAAAFTLSSKASRSGYHIHIRILLCMCPHAAMHVSAYCFFRMWRRRKKRLMLLYMCSRTTLSSCYDVSSYYRKRSLFSDAEEDEGEDAVVGVAATQTLLLPSGLV